MDYVIFIIVALATFLGVLFYKYFTKKPSDEAVTIYNSIRNNPDDWRFNSNEMSFKNNKHKLIVYLNESYIHVAGIYTTHHAGATIYYASKQLTYKFEPHDIRFLTKYLKPYIAKVKKDKDKLIQDGEAKLKEALFNELSSSRTRRPYR